MSIRELWRQRDSKLLTILGSVPVLYMVYYYGAQNTVFTWLFQPHLAPSAHDAGSAAWRNGLALVVLGLLPLLVIKLSFRDRLSDYGLGLGDTRYNLGFVLFGLLVVVPLMYLSSRRPEYRMLYPLIRSHPGSVPLFALACGLYLLYYAGYEVLFRGFLLFGSERRLGTWPAILVTTLATTLVHVTRPASEYAAAFVAGLVFGYVALRTRSIWGVLVLHFLAGVSLDFFVTFLR
jgi:membrane protease YdiL (CAAX protease family)